MAIASAGGSPVLASASARRRMSPSSKASSVIVVRLRMCDAHDGCWTRSSSRPIAITASGTRAAQPTTRSISSSRAGSAQCTSSITTRVGRREATAIRKSYQPWLPRSRWSGSSSFSGAASGRLETSRSTSPIVSSAWSPSTARRWPRTLLRASSSESPSVTAAARTSRSRSGA